MGQVHIEFTSDHQKVLQGLARSNEKLDQQVRKLRQVDRAGRGVGQSFQNAFAGISSTIAGMVGLHMAIGKVNQALQQQMELRRSVVGRIEHEEYALKRLIQISGGKPEVFKRYKEIAATLVEKPGMPHAEALDLVFKGVSLGFTDEQIKQMGQFKRFAGDVRPLLEGIAGLRAAFGKEAAGGTPESVMNAMLAAAEKSKVDVEMVAAEALTSAQAVKQLGGTAEESLAALAVATEGLKSAERAATAVGRFADVVGRDPRFRGKGLTAALVTMSQMTELQRKAVLGENIRAVRGAGVLLFKISTNTWQHSRKFNVQYLRLGDQLHGQ
ncbi:hypothetical protein AMJ85_12040 [candidate division BRC1 bacterium SM23_51]|nr:MAG: hypothetical protein AMJ85_12040 [candidate division BRC1 bacterium SM23_51]